MTTPTDETVTQFFIRMRDGDDAALQPLWEAFFPRLVSRAEQTLRNRHVRGTDAQDAAQSALVTFWKRAGQGQFAGDLHRNDLWKLLATITARKINRQIDREKALKRGAGRVRNETDAGGSGDEAFRIDDVFANVSTQEFDLHAEERLMELEPQMREIALMKFSGHTNSEMANLLECSERTIERSLNLIRKRWQSEGEQQDRTD